MTPTRVKYPLIRVLATGAMASLALLASCEAKLPTSEEVDKMTASTAVKAILGPDVAASGNVTYYVNDVVVTEAAANALASERIASVNVIQTGARNAGEVRIVTRDVAGARPAASSDKDSTYARITVSRAGENDAGTTITGRRLIESLPRTGPIFPAPGPGREGFTGLMIVDGVITEPTIVNSISPDQIVSIDIVKGAAATAQYSDPRAANGVIRITTKKAKP